MFETLAGKLLSAENVLIMTHRRPDGDALGSSMGLALFLRAQGINAEVVLPDGMPPRFRSLVPAFRSDISAAEAAQFDLFAAVDCANPERLGCGSQLDIGFLRKQNFISIDHHKGNSLAAPLEWLEPAACSASCMVAKLLLSTGKNIPADAATLLLTGIMTDTGNFCFANTDAEAFQVASELRKCGADTVKIANAVFFSKPLKQLHFEAELINSCFKMACNDRFAYCFVPEALMKKYDFNMAEDEGLIDLLRCIDGVVIAMLCHKRPDGFRVSLRSKLNQFPVGPIARELGGGGHDMAAGCTVDLPDFAAVEALMLAKVSQLLG